RAEKEKAKQVRRPMTSSDRPTPNAAYEPYGSPNAQKEGTRDLSKIPRPMHEQAARGNRWEDPYAGDEHTERRNPTTALRETEGTSVVERAGLDPNEQRVGARRGSGPRPERQARARAGRDCRRAAPAAAASFDPCRRVRAHRGTAARGRPHPAGDHAVARARTL